MKTFIFLILACMFCFIFLGCQTDQRLGQPSPGPLGPTGFCEAVGAKYKFSFEREPAITSIQALVRKNRIVVILGNAQGNTVAFLMRSVRQVSQADTLNQVETFTISYPRKVLKLEEVAAEAEGVKFNNKKYAAFVSYDKQTWIPLSEANVTPAELARDITLMEKTWKDAQRIAVVNKCKDFYTVSRKPSFKQSDNCAVSNNTCTVLWMISLDDVFADRDAEFGNPPFDIGPDDDMGDDWLSMGGGTKPSRACEGAIKDPQCGRRGLDKAQGYGYGETSSEALRQARDHVRDLCEGGNIIFAYEKVCDYSEGSDTGQHWAATVNACCSLVALPPIPPSGSGGR